MTSGGTNGDGGTSGMTSGETSGVGSGVSRASLTARERARAELTREIKVAARRQLAQQGAPQLSLRAVARELGMVSSAIYRYFASRDELLTALIIDAYNSLGEYTETAERAIPRDDSRRRWHTACAAVREWALASPHEYALIFGSPVPGYRAPQATIAPAARVPLVLGGILADTWPPSQEPAGYRRPPGPARPLSPPLSPPLAEQLAGVAAVIAPTVPAPILARAMIAWTQLFGMISFELFGQFTGGVDPADEFFAFAVGQMASFTGLP